MADLTESILPKLRARTLPGLLLPDDFIVPDYAGGSIANLPSQVAAWLGLPPFGTAPLHSPLIDPLGDGVRQVVVVLMDALGYNRFRAMLTENGSIWRRLSQQGVLAQLTSVFPSTTSAALTSIATGRAPGEHNMLGYEMWLKEYGAIANMIIFSPMSAAQQPERLREAGFDPEQFLSVPILAQHLARQGVAMQAFMPSHIAHSGLSRMHLKGVELQPYFATADLWDNVKHLLESSIGIRQFVWVYWEVVDTLSHNYGPAAESVEMEARKFGEMMARMCLDRLSAAAREGTVLIVLADHGQVDTPFDPNLDLMNHPDFTDLLHILPNGENRAAYLHCRPGQVDRARTYIEEHWPDRFHVVPQMEAMTAGLFGSHLDPRTPSRLGELLVLSRGDAYLWWAARENKMLGRHGGLTADEMLVPFLAARLDSG